MDGWRGLGKIWEMESGDGCGGVPLLRNCYEIVTRNRIPVIIL